MKIFFQRALLLKSGEALNGARQDAFSLTEVTLALGVAAFCLIAIFGLIPTGLNTNNSSIRQNLAANLAAMISSDLRATPPTLNKSFSYQLTFPSGSTAQTNGPFGLAEGGSTNSLSKADFQANVTIAPPAAGTRYASIARILITWPAGANITNASGSFESVIGLDRN